MVLLGEVLIISGFVTGPVFVEMMRPQLECRDSRAFCLSRKFALVLEIRFISVLEIRAWGFNEGSYPCWGRLAELNGYTNSIPKTDTKYLKPELGPKL